MIVFYIPHSSYFLGSFPPGRVFGANLSISLRKNFMSAVDMYISLLVPQIIGNDLVPFGSREHGNKDVNVLHYLHILHVQKSFKT